MADPFRCIGALNKAAGRELSDTEVQDIFERIQANARDLASGRVKPAKGSVDITSREGIMQHAAELAAQQMVAEKVRAERNAHLQIVAMADRQANVDAMRAGGIDGVDAVRRLLANTADGRADQFSLEARVHGTSTLIKSKVQDTWAALGSELLGFVQDRVAIRKLITEMRGEASGDAMAAKGAKAWREAAEGTRQWFNDRGGEVGKLEDWAFPQHHSQERVSKAGREVWMADVFPALDRERYVDEVGNRMSEPAIKELLFNAWESIATNGANKIEPGRPRGHGARANRHAEERQIHFKDADSVMGYWSKYGEKTFPEVLMGHLETMAKDIAFVEHFGPNPNAAFTVLRDSAERSAKLAAPTDSARIDRELARLDILFDYAAGRTKPTADMRFSSAMQGVRNLNAAGKLGSAAIASFFGDKPMFEAMAKLNSLPFMQRQMNDMRLLANAGGEAERRLLQRQGLMLEYMVNQGARYGEELGSSGWTGKLSNAIMKISLMSHVNEARRGAFGLTMMSAVGHELSTGKALAELSPQDHRMLTSFGIGEDAWRVWQLAKRDDLGHGNTNALTPEGIGRISDSALKAAGFDDPATARREALVRYMGAVTSEGYNAVMEPGWSDRVMGGQTTAQAGTLVGEIVKSVWQFKSFPIAMFKRQNELIMSRDSTLSRAALLSHFVIGQTLMGALMLQAQDLLGGKDPRNMAEWRFWVASVLKGGTLGIYGDFLYSSDATTRMGSGPLEVLAGPTLGTAATAATELVKAGNAVKDGRETHLAAKMVGLAKGFVPGSNLWYTKAVTNHLIFQRIQDMLSPGYLANMRASTEKQYKQSWWWSPGETVPDRAPDAGAAVGQ